MNDIGFHETEKGESDQGIPSMVREESYDEVKIQLENCKKRCEELRYENDRLHNRIVDLETGLGQRDNEIHRLREELDSARTEIERLQGERDMWKQKFEECRAIAERLRSEIGELKDTIGKVEEEKRKMENEIRALKDRIEKLIEENQLLEKLLKTQMDKYEYKIRELTQEIDGLKGELQGKKQLFDECQERLKKWEEEKRELERKIESLEEKLIRCRSILRDIKRLGEEASRILDTLEPESPVPRGWFEETHREEIRDIPEMPPEEPSGLEKEDLWESEKEEEGLFPL